MVESTPAREQHLKELLYEAVGWLVEYECTGNFDDRARRMLRDMIDRCDAAVGNPPNDWEEDDRLAQAKPTPTFDQTRCSGITPPPELDKQWFAAWESGDNEELSFADFVIPRAAQWGADQELGACCALMDDWGLDGEDLMQCRRPKPPSLKEQALDVLEGLRISAKAMGVGFDSETICRALEALPDD